MIATILFVLTSLVKTDSIRTEVIDGKTYIIHRVEQKETLFAISRRYGVALIAIVDSNPSASSGLEVGQLVKVPYNPNNRTKTSEGTVHKVGQKETLYSISKQYGVTVDELKDWNKLPNNNLKVGQELLVKNKPIPATNTNTSPIPVEVQSTTTTTTTTTSTTPATTPEATTPTTLPTITPTTINTIPVTTTVPVRETVIGSEEVHETGMVMTLEGTEENRKYLGHHRSVRVGTILRVKNNANQREVFVRIIGNLDSTEPSDVVLRVSQSAFNKLAGGDSKFPVEVIYFK